MTREQKEVHREGKNLMCEDNGEKKRRGQDPLGKGRKHNCGHGAREVQRYLKVKPSLEDFTQH